MKIIFVCPSLELGCNSLAEHTRLLAHACGELGHECQLLAVHDRNAAQSCLEIQRVRNREISSLRLAAASPWYDRIANAQAFVNAFSPDLVSWQIDPREFSDDGIVPAELAELSVIGNGRHKHVMLHDLWTGLIMEEPLKNRALGLRQRRALKALVLRIAPDVMHTTDAYQQIVLARENWLAGVLPLFGTIPISEETPIAPHPEKWIGGIFGPVHPQFQLNHFLNTLLAGASASKRRLRIVGLGALGEIGEAWLTAAAHDYSRLIDIELLGEKPPEKTSQLLQAFDFGIATEPMPLAGKSRYVAAMLDHGLPVIGSHNGWTLRGKPVSLPAHHRLLIPLSNMPPELMAGRLSRRRAPVSSLPAIASTFLSHLENVNASLAAAS